MSNNDGPRETSVQATVPVFAPVAAPILRSIDPVKVARFLKERERYELEISSKQAEVPTLQLVSYKASIDRSLLKSLFRLGKFDALVPGLTSAKELTDQDIQVYIESLVKRSDTEALDPNIIKGALTGFSMPMKILDAEARVTTYCADFFERLEGVGCGDFPDENPKKSVRLLLSRLEPPALKKEMRDRVDYDESLEKSVKNFCKTA